MLNVASDDALTQNESVDCRARVAAASIAADIGTWLWDVPGDALRGDRNLNVMFGLPPQPTNRPVADYLKSVHPEDLARVSDAIAQALGRGGSDRFEATYRVIAGDELRWVLARGVVKRNDQGDARELSGVVLDISEQKQLEAERSRLLERAETQARIFDTTLSSITDFAYIFDIDGRFLYVNKALLDLWGLPLEEAVGKNFFDLQYPDALAARLQAQIQQVIDTRKGLSDETPYTSPTGAGGFYEYIFSPVFAPDGSVQVVAGSTRDVTARKRTEESLRSRTAQFETLFNDAPLGIYLVDADFRLREVNPLARPIFGDIPDLVGRDFEEIIHILWPQNYASEVVRLFRRTLETGEPYSTPERVEKRRDLQRTEIYEWQVNRITLPDGRYGVVCYFREVSAHVHAQRVLKAADQQKNEFLAMLAHELRNPLAPIRNSGELLARALVSNPQAQTAVGIIRRQVSHLTRLVDDLLDVSRISQGRIELKIEQLELTAIISQAVETVGPPVRAKKHNLSITTSYLPLYVLGDPARLIQCVGNILMNAVKFTDEGGQIRVETYGDDSQAVISITDNGIGISEELQLRLFDLFVQGERTLDRAQGGLGIGLAVVKRLIEMHGGTVSVESRGAGTGTAFRITLPRVAYMETPDETPQPIKATPRRVLIVDDNTDSANSLAMLLELEGHETEVVYSAREALERVTSFLPDIVLLDIGLPEIDGYEVARRMRELPIGRQMKLVAVTGYGQSDDRARARTAGFDEHLVKPVEFAMLERVLSA